MSVPPVPKRSSWKRFYDSCHGCVCSWASFNGIQHALKCCISFWSRTRFEWDVICTIQLCGAPFVPIWLTRLGWVQHIITSITSRGNHTTTTQCFVQNVPPASRGIIYAMSMFFLQSCSNITRMTCFWWQLTHNITIHTIRLSLKESCLKINVTNVPTLAGCHFATHPESRSCGSKESVCWCSFCLSWKPLTTHLALALRKFPCLSVLTVSTHHPVTWFLGLTFLRSRRSKTSLSTQDLHSKSFASADCL